MCQLIRMTWVTNTMFNVRIRGIDAALRGLIRADDAIERFARQGVNKAAEHLMDKVIAKFGKYQPTGGDPKGYGGWRKLKFTTLKKKASKGQPMVPLIATGETVSSFSIKEGGRGRLAASVSSSSDHLVYHVYGVPGRNIPMRDPIRITAIEEKQACHDIIEEYVMDALRRSGL